jgi:hypothetical protein
MIGVILISAGSIALVVGAVRFMHRVNRADQRKIERIREEWEASGRETPWTWDVWGKGA